MPLNSPGCGRRLVHQTRSWARLVSPLFACGSSGFIQCAFNWCRTGGSVLPSTLLPSKHIRVPILSLPIRYHMHNLFPTSDCKQIGAIARNKTCTYRLCLTTNPSEPIPNSINALIRFNRCMVLAISC
ncbi:hypothetical protein BU24DRAFT_42540 [Aaosphaeria arxii CBS 175.79]|uniref:Uncharacterized protein n=1 Tax=Aaosphaeria arxii CBS 175.79 TaxID=1450172 RepID=A0A6A5Y9P8_9PLEO|nr:uncharacterized protein BU24DRAFT_42540 [Aaosphaeria arxii CBS 175.79]KAF2022315.1 hypothetical protein BU24DRAFT_42540 [Aaosphaeria arxii CBS 175.79]